MDKKEQIVPKKSCKNKINKNREFTLEDALVQFEELKDIALSCFDKNGNPNISAAIRAVENKAKIAGLYSKNEINTQTVIRMGEITIDGRQLRLNIGDEYFND